METELAQPFIETFEPRGERRLVSRWLFVITSLARVVGHAFDIRDREGKIATVPPPQGRADHTDWVYTSQEQGACGNSLKMKTNPTTGGESRGNLFGRCRDLQKAPRADRIARFLERRQW